MEGVDVWILGFERAEEPPAARLVRVFGLSVDAAEQIELSLPIAVKRGLSAEEASVYVEALRGIGARVELKPARAPSASAGRPPSLAAPRSVSPFAFEEEPEPRPAERVLDGVPGTEWGGLESITTASSPALAPSSFEEEVVAPRDLSALEQGARDSRRPGPFEGAPSSPPTSSPLASTPPSSRLTSSPLAPTPPASSPPATSTSPSLPPDWDDLPSFDDGPASFDTWDGSLALADVAPTRRPSAAPAPVLVTPLSSPPRPSSRPPSSMSSTAPTSFTPNASIGELESSSQPISVALGQLVGGLLLLGVGSFGRGGLFGGLTMASGAGLVVLGAANLVRALVFRVPAWDSFLPRAASFLVGFCLVGFFTLRSFFVVDESEMAEVEAAIQAELASGEDADTYLHRNPTHRLGSLTPANSVALVGTLKARGATAVTISADDVFGNVVGGVAVRMPAAEAQRAQIRQTLWNAVRADAQAAGYTYEDFVAEPLQGDWWSVWLLLED